MLNEVTIPIDLGQGVDTKFDPKLVVAGKMLRLENAVFTAVKRISKRNGYTAITNAIAGGGTLVAPTMVHSYNNELIVADNNRLYGYSPSQNSWIDEGSYISTELSRTNIDQNHPVSGFVDSAVLGNYVIYGWSTPGGPFVHDVETYGSVVDLQTGIAIGGPQKLSPSLLVQDLNPVKCAVLGGSTLAIFYINTTSTAIVIRTVSFVAGAAVFSAETSVSTGYLNGHFDVVETATGAAIFYVSTTGVTLTTLNTAGVIVNTVVIADAAAIPPAIAISYPLHVSVNTNGNIWIWWSDATYGGFTSTSRSIVYSVYSPTLVLVLAKTVAYVMAAPFVVTNMITTNDSVTQQSLYFGKFVADGGAAYIDSSYYLTATSAGIITVPALFSNGVTPYSRSFVITKNGITNKYAVFIFRGHDFGDGFHFQTVDSTFFVIKLSNISAGQIPVMASRFASGVAISKATLFGSIAYTSNSYFTNTNAALFATGVETQEFNSDIFIEIGSSTNPVGAFAYSIDFNSANTTRATDAGNLSVLNGSVVHVYDGQTVTEFNFNMFPEITSATPTAGLGNIVPGTYSYLAIFQWTDSTGGLHQSATSIPVSVTPAGGENTVVINVTTNYLSQKIGASVAIYRTQNGGTVYYLVTDPTFVLNADPTTGAFVTFTDILSDLAIAGNPQAYSYPASPVLENSTPPPSTVMVAHNNRLWFVDSESQNNIWYTKSFSPGTGLSPSALMTEDIDPKFGPITALAEMDDKLVSFKQYGILAQSGDGVNDTGTGSTLSFPQTIASDVGCTVLKSAVVTPVGVMFKSANGIYLLNRSLTTSYLGMEVEQYNGQTITNASLISGKSQARFLVSGGLTLVYDYIFNQWSTFTGHTGFSADNWQGSYVYAQSNGRIFKESPGYYLDNNSSFSLLAQTSWLNLAGVQSFQRVRRLSMLGDFVNGASAAHSMQIQAAYDFSTSFSAAVPFVFGAASAASVIQYRERLQQQKCETISLLIQEIVTGSSLEYIDLSNICFEAAVKKGIDKQPATHSVG